MYDKTIIIKNKELIESENNHFLELYNDRDYQFFLHSEIDELENTETVLLQLKNNKSGITFYSPKAKSFCFFVYVGINSFYMPVSKEYIKIKGWYNDLIDFDVRGIANHLEANEERIFKIYENI